MRTIYTLNSETEVTALADADEFALYDASASVIGKIGADKVRPYVHSGVVNVTAATVTITQAAHGGQTVTLNRAGGIAVTLPAATGTGAVYKFFVGTTFTSDATIKAASATDSFLGNGIVLADAGDTMVGFEIAANDDTITLNGSTKGGIAGDFIEIIDVASGLFYVRALLSGTGSEATPFSATVS